MNYKKIIKLFLLLYLASGIPLGLFFWMFGKFLMHTLDKSVETTAVIAYLVKEPDKLQHDTYVTYTVDDVSYTEKLNISSFKDEVGKELTIFYDPSKPQRIYGDSRLFFTFMICSGSFVCIINALGTVVMLIVLLCEKMIRRRSANRKEPQP